MKSESRILQVHLTPEELEAAGKNLSSMQIRLRELEAEKKLAMQQYKQRIDAVRGQVDELSVRHHSGLMMREVECELRPDLHALAIDVVRLDTGEVIERRPMTPSERQTPLPGVGN